MKALGKKILAVMKEVGPITKDARNEFHKYDYVSDAAVVRAMRTAMISHGLVLMPSHTNVFSAGDLTTLHVSYTLTDVESGESATTLIMACGSDKGDKGIYKAMTGAEKYYLTKTFLIPTEDGAEVDKDEKPRRTAPITWEAPKLSTQLEKPTTPVAQALKDIVRRNVPIGEVLVDEIKARLYELSGGDEAQAALILKEQTMYSKGTKWVEPDGLKSIAKSKPDWIEGIHAKVMSLQQ